MSWPPPDVAPALLIAAGAAAAAWLLVREFAVRRASTRARHFREAALLGLREGPDARTPGRIAIRLRGARPAVHSAARSRLAAIDARLRDAGVDATTAEFLGVESAALVAVGLAGAALFGSSGALVGALIGIVLPVLLLRRRRAARLARVNEQLPDLLQVLAGSLHAGQSFLQALDHAAGELGQPLRGELRVMLREVELGVSVEEALDGMCRRVPDADLGLVVDAVLIQRRVGGNLAEVLSNIAATIRERIRIRGEVRSLTGQARMSGWVLSALPVALGAGLLLLNPAYMSPLVTTPLGRLMLLAALGSELVGMLAIRRIANVRV